MRRRGCTFHSGDAILKGSACVCIFLTLQVNQKDKERFERPGPYESTSFSLTPLYQDTKHCSQVFGFSLLNL